jgi:hypothetical protein
MGKETPGLKRMIDEHIDGPIRIKGTLVRSYSTRFLVDEDPISEGGIWLSGKKDAIDWTDVVTKNGIAYGAAAEVAVAERRMEQGNLSPTSGQAAPEGDYSDPAALLGGVWGRNQHVRAEVFSRNQTEEYFQEVEIRLRSTLSPHFATGYEVFWRCLKTKTAYAEVVTWNGKVKDWTSLQRHVGSEFGVKDGDVVEATIVGNAIKGFINGVEVLSVIDDKFEAGSPGIGFNFGVGDTNVDHGFRSFEVETYGD